MKVLPLKGRLWLILVISISLFVVYSAVGERGFIRFVQMSRQREELKIRVRNLQKSNAELGEHISLLRDDPKTIENLARTELGMVREGETVFIFSDQPGEEPK